MVRTIRPLALGIALGLAGWGCSTSHQHGATGASVVRAADMGADVKEAVAVVHGTKGNEKVMGVVKFSDADGGGVKVTADVDGLEANSEHGFHIHEFGDATAPDGMSAGGHFNPDKHQHGKPGDPNSHPGDMGNLKADDKGHAHLEITLAQASVSGKNAVLGRGVIVHAKPDDFSQPTGNAGGRIGIGVIGVAQVKK
jgi:superoxide dismutase, Cu-Zn family